MAGNGLEGRDVHISEAMANAVPTPTQDVEMSTMDKSNDNRDPCLVTFDEPFDGDNPK